jgi:hypothetical protein
MVKHVNMFNHAAEKREVYEALQSHYERDSHVISYMDLAIVAFVIAALYFGWRDWWAWLIGIGLVGSRMCFFIDNSNRNWAMHVIDWIEATKSGSD